MYNIYNNYNYNCNHTHNKINMVLCNLLCKMSVSFHAVFHNSNPSRKC